MFSAVTATLTPAGQFTLSPEFSVVLFRNTIAMLSAGIPVEGIGWYVIVPLPWGAYAKGVASIVLPFQTSVTFIGVLHVFVTNAAKQLPEETDESDGSE